VKAWKDRGARRWLLLLLAAAGFYGCGGEDREGKEMWLETGAAAERGVLPVSPPPEAPPPPRPDMAVSQGEEADFGAQTAGTQAAHPAGDDAAVRMIIRTGWARVEVDTVERSIERLRALTERHGGHVANLSVQAGREEHRQATLELKVPADRFDALVSGLAGLGRVRTVSVQAQDVGEEYTDLEARLANARRLESRFLELLAARTGNLADVLAVERELARVREQIERTEGRLRFLRSRVALSTLTVTLEEPSPLLGRPGANPIADAFRQAWRNFVALIAGMIAALGVVLPLAVLLGAAWLAFRALRRRRRV
jgi:acetolactate synthase regulatory subunit